MEKLLRNRTSTLFPHLSSSSGHCVRKAYAILMKGARAQTRNKHMTTITRHAITQFCTRTYNYSCLPCAPARASCISLFNPSVPTLKLSTGLSALILSTLTPSDNDFLRWRRMWGHASDVGDGGLDPSSVFEGIREYVELRGEDPGDFPLAILW